MANEKFVGKEIQKSLAQLSLEKIRFPTDKISVADLRECVPNDFEWRISESNSFTEKDSFSVLLDNALHYERMLAAFSFCEQKALPIDQILHGIRKNDKEELIRMLHQSYEPIGLSRSMEETSQLADNIAAEVKSQHKSEFLAP